MAKNKTYLHVHPIPKGMQIFNNRVYVAGLKHRKDAAQHFARATEKAIHFRRENLNPHDPNAIAVVGEYRKWLRTKQVHLGYVPAEISKQIVEKGFWGKVDARLQEIFFGDNGYLDIYFQVLGPKGEKKEYSD